MLVIAQYPTIQDIFWDWCADTIDEKDAFFLIEKRWNYIDHKNLTHLEQQLIQALTDKYGNSILLVA